MINQQNHFKKLTCAVIGLGGSGLSAVKFLAKEGHQIIVLDENKAPSLADQLPSGVQSHFGGLDEQILCDVDQIVISPGVDPRHVAIIAAKQKGIPVVSDIEVFAQRLHQKNQQLDKKIPLVAITGSNAKSTVTTLVAQMAADAGLVVGAGGNLGTPALDLLSIENLQIAVLELSSFQLEHVSGLGADVATILNLSADHLDRHGDMAGYLAQKLRIFDQAKSAVVCLDDQNLAQQCLQVLASDASVIHTSSLADSCLDADFYLSTQDDEICLCYQRDVLLTASQLLIKGKHNLLNALSALALGYAVGLPLDSMVQTLKSFKGLPHRCEYVAQVDSQVYFNDSKGTNIGSTIAAINGLGAVFGEQSLALILGGQGKGQDFSELANDVCKYAHTAYLIGEDASLIEKGLLSIDQQCVLVHAQTLAQAVQLASHNKSAKAVLLSPACASFDQFKGYADRGNQFVNLVNQLQARS